MLIFPEGGRSPDGWGQPFRGGAAYLSQRCGVPVVPIHIEGTGRSSARAPSGPRPAHDRSPSARRCDPATARTPALRRADRARRRRAGRRGHRPTGGSARRRAARRRDAAAHRPGRPRLAAGLGPRRPQAPPVRPSDAGPKLSAARHCATPTRRRPRGGDAGLRDAAGRRRTRCGGPGRRARSTSTGSPVGSEVMRSQRSTGEPDRDLEHLGVACVGHRRADRLHRAAQRLRRCSS